jgi:EpsI family protein
MQMAAAWGISLGERPPTAPDLTSLPAEIGAWTMTGEQALEPEVVAYLRPDDYIDRNYLARGPAGNINVFVAYFKSLKSGYGPHSPGICLPGAGWKPVQFGVVQAPVPGSRGSIPVNQYFLEKGNQKLLVLYWYQNERRIWAEEFRAKIYMLPDLLRYHRSDVALIRIVTPLDPNAVEATKSGLFRFVNTAFPLLSERFSNIGR